MFYNLNATEKVNNMLKYASIFAEKYNSKQIATNYLLFGMLFLKDCKVTQILNDIGINKTNFENTLKTSEKTENDESVSDLQLTTLSKQVFLISQELATQVKSEYVDIEHILFAILLNTESEAVKALQNTFNVDFSDLKNKLFALMKNSSVESTQQAEIALPEVLKDMGMDITQNAKNGKYDNIIGRDDEINRVIEILCRKTKNNPILIGEAGVGKTAIVEGLAQKIVKNDVPENLKNKTIFFLDIAEMISGTKYRGALEEKLKKVIQTVLDNKNIILFIDEIHTLNQAGAKEGEVNPSDILKPYLARGDLQTIGATTTDEYKKFIEKDKALERRFQPVMVEPPNIEDTILILQGLKSGFEKYHNVKISDEAINAAVTLSVRYITNRNLPDKAIDLIDEAGAKAKIESLAKSSTEIPTINANEIAKIVSDWTKIPVDKINSSEKSKLLNLENIIHKRVIGQEEAVDSVAKAIRRARIGLKDNKKPIGSFMFLGQTGVGKTELAKALAEVLFDDENNIIRYDMSEFMEAHSVSKLIGSPAGYVGYEDGGNLTEKVRRKPYSIVLFDEIEKAHPDILNLMLQMLDDGRLTDGSGRLTNFQNTLIIFTSNLGAKEVLESGEVNYESQKEIVLKALKNKFKPEFINRIDVLAVFKPLSKEDLAKIAKIMITDLSKRLKEHNLTLKLTTGALLYLIQKGYNYQYGARPLKRLIEQEIEDVIAEDILNNICENNDTILVGEKNNSLTFDYLKQNNI